MPTLEEIQVQIKNLDGISKFFGRREIKELPNILWEKERVNGVVQGFYMNGQGLLIASDKRLIFIDKGYFGKIRVEDFPYDKISTIQYTTGMMFGTITIFTSGNKAVITQIDKLQARTFAETVRSRITKAIDTPEIQSSGKTIESPEELYKYKDLLDAGIITQEEFDAKKKSILNL